MFVLIPESVVSPEDALPGTECLIGPKGFSLVGCREYLARTPTWGLGLGGFLDTTNGFLGSF